MSLFLHKRFLGKVEDQNQIKTIGQRLILELEVHSDHINQSKERLSQLAGKPEKKVEADQDNNRLDLMQTVIKE